MKYIIYLLLISTLSSNCGAPDVSAEIAQASNEKNIVTLTEAQFKNAGIETGALTQKDISTILKVNGKIDVPPQNMVSISVPLGGYLKSTRLLPGMHVKKGEIVAVMEDQQYIQLQQDYLTATARIAYLDNEYQRQKELNLSKASSDKAFQLAEADFESQKVLIAALAQKLQLAGININQLNAKTISRTVNVYSPINGFVSKVYVNIGKYVSPTEVLFDLVNPADIHLALKVFEKDLSKLTIGQNLVAFTNNKTDKKYPCKILLIGKDLSPERNADVHCHFESYDKDLIPGTYMNGEIEINSKKAYVLPADAILNFEGANYIFQQKSKTSFTLSPVTVGESEQGYTEIVLPPQPMLSNTPIVIKGAYSLLMMMKNKAE
jgi:membrane fusion protein, heavy metal efflux system